MSKRDLLCSICKSAVLGTVENSMLAQDDNLACGPCGRSWNKFRVDVDAAKRDGAALAFDQLTIRGVNAAHLHQKLLDTRPEEAAKLAAMADIMEAIRSAK